MFSHNFIIALYLLASGLSGLTAANLITDNIDAIKQRPAILCQLMSGVQELCRNETRDTFLLECKNTLEVGLNVSHTFGIVCHEGMDQMIGQDYELNDNPGQKTMHDGIGSELVALTTIICFIGLCAIIVGIIVLKKKCPKSRTIDSEGQFFELK